MNYDLTTKTKRSSNNSTPSPSSPLPSPPDSNLSTLFVEPSETPPTQAQIDIVRYTWERVCDIRLDTDDEHVSPAHAFALEFYDALFRIKPSARDLFPNIFQQARALAGLVSYIVRAPSVVCSPTEDIPGNYSGKIKNRRLSDADQYCSFSNAFMMKNSGGTQDLNEQSACPMANQSKGRIMSVRELNALKRHESTASNFSELVTDVVTAAATDTTSTKKKNRSSLSLPDTLADLNDVESSNEYQKKLLQKLRELGARHYFYHTQPEDLPLVVPAVLQALKARLCNEYLPEVEDAWIKAQAYVIYHMKAGLEEQIALQHGGKKKSAFAQFKASVTINSQHNTKSNCTIQ